MKRIFLFSLSVLCISIIGLPVLQTALGYFPGAPGWKVAKLAAERREVQLCHRIVDLPWGMFSMGPSVAESQFLCIHEYAKLTKDPLACELLMPSSYGLDCVGAAEDFDPCIMLADAKKTVKGQGLETTYDSCQDGDGAQHVCCAMARVLYDDERNCGDFPQGELRDQCHHIVGVKMKSIEECTFIENERNRTGCEIIVRAYLTGRL